MPSLRSRSKKLKCFYCGKRSNLQFDGRSSFLCTYCDATNWLDQNGDITDPPSTTQLSPQAPVRYAMPGRQSTRSPSPLLSTQEATQMNSIFCPTCLRNQQFVAESLKNFEFPDDLNSPEYVQRQRKYRKWKLDLERRYPQMCADCEPRVQEQLQKASYLAKTDHLRRMMDRTRAQRLETKQFTKLDAVDTILRWAWKLAFIMQSMWHIMVLGALLDHFYSSSRIEQKIPSSLRGVLPWILKWMSPWDRLIRASVNTSLISFLWNPKFKQTIRGFTAHIIGIREWYTYQLIVIIIRCGCLFISQSTEAKALPAMTQVGAHVVIAGLMVFVYKAAVKSIHTDTTPLFGVGQSTPPAQRRRRLENSEGQSESLGDALDDILRSEPATNVRSSTTSYSAPSSFQFTDADRNAPGRSFASPAERVQPDVSFDSLKLSDSPVFKRPEPQVVQYDDEMDWTPSGSQHRAFSTHNPFKVKNPHPRFSDAPIEEKHGAFWYKVPPAPTNPAQRQRNPPLRPMIHESPKEKTENFFQASTRGPIDMGRQSYGVGSDVIFKDSSFHAPEQSNDPRDGLSRMMGSFSISPDPDDHSMRARYTGSTSRKVENKERTTGPQDHVKDRVAELIVLCLALLTWTTALGTKEIYGPTLALGSICASLMVSLRLAVDLFVENELRTARPPMMFSSSWATLGSLQVVAVLALLWQIWARSSSVDAYGLYGNVLFGVTLAHQVWRIFR